MNRSGFTLVELAIVMIIIGVISVGGVRMIYSAMDSSKFTSSRNQVQSLLQQVGEYSALSKSIPSTSNWTTILSPSNDSFKTEINYVPAPNLTSTESICSASKTDMSVNASTGTVNNVAVFISSNSVNTTKDIDDSNTSNILLNESNADNDDITGWLTLDSLKRYAGCEGSSMSIIEDKLPQAYVESTYNFNLHPLGGTGTYEWCVESSDSNIRSELEYASINIMDSGECTDGTNDAADFANTTNLIISSPSDLTTSIPATSKLRVYLRDLPDGFTVYKDYSFSVAQEYELVLNMADDDGDNVRNSKDLCANTPGGSTVNSVGCPDTDGDGVYDNEDLCSGTPAGTTVDADGCPASNDSDGDGVSDDDDLCPNTPSGSTVNDTGCVDTNGDGTPDDPDDPTTTVPDFGSGEPGGFITANIDLSTNTQEDGQVGTDYNSGLVSLDTSNPDHIEISSTGNSNGAACVWYSGKGGIAFKNRYILSYFEFETNTSNLFEGFTYGLIKNVRPPVGDDGTAQESAYVSSEDDCGDTGNGIGYSYADPAGPSSNAIYGSGFAVEFDPRTSSQKNDHSGGGSSNDHIAIVSNKDNYAYNVHNSSPNDFCQSFTTISGCYNDSSVMSGRKSVRIEAYSGCDSGGNTCTGSAGNNVCVYVWLEDEVASDSLMRDTSTGYMLTSGAIAFGDPLVYDCYEIPSGSLDFVRPGFTFSNLGTGTSLDYYNYAIQSIAY
ncbi:MAG: hypothetical protein C0602_01195 [Denitrovibrio sp.]|nr:MAG: hypothetical protein C0602_01195 [Denitrovibrio sp.]